jgi:VCBS repeat-containing protein
MNLNRYVSGASSSQPGRIYTRRAISLLSGTYTADVNGSAVELGDCATLNLELTNTTHAGTTPTCDITVQGSNDGTNWYSLGTFTQITTTDATQRKAFPAARYVRGVVDVGGTTPSYALTLTGEAV